MAEPLSVHGPVKMAITVDDLFLWPDAGTPERLQPGQLRRQPDPRVRG